MDLSKIKDIKDLQALLDLMGQYGLVELELEGEGRTIRFRKAEAGFPPREAAQAAVSPLDGRAVSPSAPAQSPPALLNPGTASSAKIHEVPSPLVGTFYRAPSPEAEPFVREGDRVESETFVCIIEAMKVMNEIPAGVAGVVREALVKNGESVEFGQPLFRIEVE